MGNLSKYIISCVLWSKLFFTFVQIVTNASTTGHIGNPLMEIFPWGHKCVVLLHLDHVLEWACDRLLVTAPLQGNVGGITLVDAQRLLWTRHIQAQAATASDIKQAVVWNPLPQHVLVGWFAVLQGQCRLAGLNTFLEVLTLDNEDSFIWNSKVEDIVENLHI